MVYYGSSCAAETVRFAEQHAVGLAGGPQHLTSRVARAVSLALQSAGYTVTIQATRMFGFADEVALGPQTPKAIACKIQLEEQRLIDMCVLDNLLAKRDALFGAFNLAPLTSVACFGGALLSQNVVES
jgi:hypothetical protein